MSEQVNVRQQITASNLADILHPTIWQVTETTAKKYGHWGLLQKSRSVVGYQAAEQSWKQAWEKFFLSRTFKQLGKLSESSEKAVIELFFAQIRANPSDALKRNNRLVWRAAQSGDVSFFKRIVKEMRNAGRAKPRATIAFDILAHWLASCLWLASDYAGSTYLQQITGKPVDEGTYARARSRLNLSGYETAHRNPIITGCTKNKTFIFSKQWTNMDPRLSR